jgi:hypothetical protein
MAAEFLKNTRESVLMSSLPTEFFKDSDRLNRRLRLHNNFTGNEQINTDLIRIVLAFQTRVDKEEKLARRV